MNKKLMDFFAYSGNISTGLILLYYFIKSFLNINIPSENYIFMLLLIVLIIFFISIMVVWVGNIKIIREQKSQNLANQNFLGAVIFPFISPYYYFKIVRKFLK